MADENRILEKLERLQDSVTSVEKKFTSVDNRLEGYNEELAKHIKRTNLLEEGLKNMKEVQAERHASLKEVLNAINLRMLVKSVLIVLLTSAVWQFINLLKDFLRIAEITPQ